MKFNYVPAYAFGKAKKNELNKTDQLITPSPDKYHPIKMTSRMENRYISKTKRSKFRKSRTRCI